MVTNGRDSGVGWWMKGSQDCRRVMKEEEAKEGFEGDVSEVERRGKREGELAGAGTTIVQRAVIVEVE